MHVQANEVVPGLEPDIQGAAALRIGRGPVAEQANTGTPNGGLASTRIRQGSDSEAVELVGDNRARVHGQHILRLGAGGCARRLIPNYTKRPLTCEI